MYRKTMLGILGIYGKQEKCVIVSILIFATYEIHGKKDVLCKKIKFLRK